MSTARSSRAPGILAGTEAAAITGAGLAIAAGAFAAATAPIASSFVTRPPGPVPVAADAATPASPSTRAAAGMTLAPSLGDIWTEPMSTRLPVRFTSTTGWPPGAA